MTQFIQGEGEWWKTLQVGDQVIYDTGVGNILVLTVEKVTETLIKFNGGVAIYRESGAMRGAGKWDRSNFYPGTAHNRQQFGYVKARNRMKNFDWSTVSDEKVWDIWRQLNQ